MSWDSAVCIRTTRARRRRWWTMMSGPTGMGIITKREPWPGMTRPPLENGQDTTPGEITIDVGLDSRTRPAARDCGQPDQAQNTGHERTSERA
jgi:hypothetical protein